jgi:hypothetical protein
MHCYSAIVYHIVNCLQVIFQILLKYSLSTPYISQPWGTFIKPGGTLRPPAGSILHLFFIRLFNNEFEKNITNIALPRGTWYNSSGLLGLVAMIYVSLISDIPEPQHITVDVACVLSPLDNAEATSSVNIHRPVCHRVANCIKRSYRYFPH